MTPDHETKLKLAHHPNPDGRCPDCHKPLTARNRSDDTVSGKPLCKACSENRWNKLVWAENEFAESLAK